MNPVAAVLLGVGGLALLAGLVLLILWIFLRQAGVRRQEYSRMRAERDLALSALELVDQAADRIRDIGDPNALLAGEVRHIVRETRNERLKIK